jgi:hypothetical protein
MTKAADMAPAVILAPARVDLAGVDTLLTPAGAMLMRC